MEASVQKRIYSCWILIEPAKDIPGVWVSHCLNFDVVSQGVTAEQALEAACEAVQMILVDDLTEHLDPLERGPAPQEDWDRLTKILAGGKQVKLPEVPADAKLFLAKQVNFVTEVTTVEVPVRKSNPSFDPNFEPVSVAPMPPMLPAFGCQTSMAY